MLVGCSEISISVIVKHVQHVGIIRVFVCLGGLTIFFQCLGGPEEIVGLWFARGDQ